MYAVVDIETTGGTWSNGGRITEVAVVKYDGFKELDRWSTLINPECTIPPFITGLTGINNNMVQSAPRFHEIAKELILRTEGLTFVAHNVQFDYRFIEAEYQKLGYRYVRKQLCTCKLSRKLLPQLRRHNLDTLLAHYAITIPPGQRHRALGDAAATAQILGYLLSIIR